MTRSQRQQILQQGHQNTFALLIAALFIAVILAGIILLHLLSPRPTSPVPTIPTPTGAPAVSITLPAPGSIVTSPLLIRGQLDHNTSQIRQVYIRLYDEKGLVKEINTDVQALNSNMPYLQTTMTFDPPTTSRGYLEVIGPSGSPLTPLRVPVYFTQLDAPNKTL